MFVTVFVRAIFPQQETSFQLVFVPADFCVTENEVIFSQDVHTSIV